MASGAKEVETAAIDYIIKRNDSRSPYRVAIEFICSSLAAAIGLTTPSFAIIEDDGERIFASAKICDFDSKHIPTIQEIVSRHTCVAYGVVAFDLWIMNRDRGLNNLLVVDNKQQLVAIDHEHSLVWHDDGFSMCERSARYEHLITNHAIAPHLSSWRPAEPWVRRIQGIAADQLREIVHQAAYLQMSSDTQEFCIDMLLFRRERLEQLFLDFRQSPE